MTIRRMRIAYWIPKATDTHSEYIILTFFSTATMIALKSVVVRFNIHCLSCLG
jgi:hypothetical protein